MLALGIALACTACTSDGAADPALPAAGAIPVGDQLAIEATITTLNSAAAGPVAEQQTALRSVVDAAATAALDACPPATTTMRFEPVWTGLRPDPAIGDTPDGTGYALPTRIRVYTADRVTATDLTTLQLTVRSGAAYLTPICAG